MKRTLLTWCVLVTFALSSMAYAQQGGGGGGGSTGGGGTGGGGAGSGGSTGGGTAAPTASGGDRGGSSGSSSSGGGGGGGGSTGAGTGSAGESLGMVGTQGVNIRQGFLEPVSRLGTGFLTPSNAASNRSANTVTSSRRTTGATGSARMTTGRALGGASGLAGRAGLGGFGSQFGNTGLGTGNGYMAPLRVPIRLGANTGMSPSGVSAAAPRFSQRIARLPAVAGVSSVSLETQGGTAILRGTVMTAQQRDLLGRLALLEPGISAVQNELAVTPLPAAAEPVPTPTASASSP